MWGRLTCQAREKREEGKKEGEGKGRAGKRERGHESNPETEAVEGRGRPPAGSASRESGGQAWQGKVNSADMTGRWDKVCEVFLFDFVSKSQ